MEKDTQLGSTLVEVLRSDSIVDIAKDYAEMGIDSILESGAFKDIPFVNTIVSAVDAVGAVKNQLLTNKLIRFLNHISEISQEERIKMVDKLNEDDKFSGKAGAALIEILDRMESQKKPELAAKCFAAYARNEISFEELRRILFALERVLFFDIEKLEEFSKKQSPEMDESLLLAFVNAGLGKNNGGLDGGVIIPTDLCIKFVKTCIAK